MSRLLHGIIRRAKSVARYFIARSDDLLIALYASSLSANIKNFLRTLVNLIRVPTKLILRGTRLKVHLYKEKEGLQVAYIGEGDWVPFLTHLLESDAPVEQELDEMAFWRIPARIKSLSLEADLIFVEVNKLLVRWVSRGSEFRTLLWVRQVLDVSGQWEDVKNRLHKNTKGTDMRKIRKYKYTYEITTDDKAYKDFFDNMYLPYISDRYSGRAVLDDIHDLRGYFDRGVLLIVKREEEPVGGTLCMISGETCFSIVFGVKDGDFTLVKEGVIAAQYYFVILWAQEQGCKRVDFGRSRAVLDDGVFRYKRKWGTEVVHDWWGHTEIAVHVSDWNPQVLEFLTKHPFISSERGQLKGMIVLDRSSLVSDAELDEIRLRYDTPGLAGLVFQVPGFHVGGQ
jgi:hypothetical protein